MSQNPTLVIYHGNCPDGFAAAYAAWIALGRCGEAGDLLFHGATHGVAINKLPLEAGQQIYLLDFSYSRGEMVEICRQAGQVTVIDHHISAAKGLSGLDSEIANLTLHFAMEHSGAVLAWHHFLPDLPLPELYLDIEDRDIWLNRRPHSRDITTAITAYPYDFKRWQQWLSEGSVAYLRLQQEGESINRYRRQLIDRYKKSATLGTIAGYRVPVVNAPAELTSDLLGELAVGHPFAAGYMQKEDLRSWSLRSDGQRGIDVSQVAASYGGGGHRNAAGFTTPMAAVTPLPAPDSAAGESQVISR
ncbi:MAG: phosphoesterase [Gammaproteobacteria bacterium]|nr:phosphoesterase [Gammaproteobacteria bacterium]